MVLIDLICAIATAGAVKVFFCVVDLNLRVREGFDQVCGEKDKESNKVNKRKQLLHVMKQTQKCRFN